MGEIIERLERGERWWAAEILLRTAGLGLLGLCGAAALWLYRLVQMPPPQHGLRVIEALAALAVVLCWSGGWSLLAEGPGLFRLIDVPGRYRHFSS